MKQSFCHGVLLAEGVSLLKVTMMGKAHRHTAQPFTLGRSDEKWHFKLDCLLVPCVGLEGAAGHLCIFYRGGEYVLVAAETEQRTHDLLMMACFVEDFLQKRTTP